MDEQEGGKDITDEHFGFQQGHRLPPLLCRYSSVPQRGAQGSEPVFP